MKLVGDSGATHTRLAPAEPHGNAWRFTRLKQCQTGGVYLAGGMIPAWGGNFDTRVFRAGFEEKTPRAGWLAAIPSYVVYHAQPGLFGLAVMAAASG